MTAVHLVRPRRATRPLQLVALIGLLASTGLLGLAPTAAGASTQLRRHVAAVPHDLLALGDSLAAGYQPTDGTKAPPVDPATGRPDQGYPGGYAADIASTRHLDLVDLACPGETTTSMTTKPAIGQCTSLYKAAYGAPTQLVAAEDFLAHHVGQVGLVTIDLGANDVDGCASAGGFDLACVTSGERAVTSRLPAIVATLKSLLRSDDPGARLVAMNYYDPFLGVAYAPGGLKGTAVAALSVAATDMLNGELATIYKRAGVAVANVAAAFGTGKALPLATYAGHHLPLDVDYVCRWTWMCPLPGSAHTANIHANTVGYRVIAGAFEKVLAAA